MCRPAPAPAGPDRRGQDVTGDLSAGMRRYWQDRARENAVWYVDTSLAYDEPDMERFWQTGRTVVAEALLQAPVRPHRRELAVEIGPGLGRICRALAEHFERVVGIDISEEMVRRARELLDEPRVELVVGDGSTLRPLEDASVDFVTTFTVLQHQDSVELVGSYLREAARVLRPGGVLAAQWNGDAHPLRYRVRGRWWRLQRRLGVPGMQDARVAPEFLGRPVPMAEVRATLEQAGLVIRGTKGEGTLFSWIWAEKPA